VPIQFLQERHVSGKSSKHDSMHHFKLQAMPTTEEVEPIDGTSGAYCLINVDKAASNDILLVYPTVFEGIQVKASEDISTVPCSFGGIQVKASEDIFLGKPHNSQGQGNLKVGSPDGGSTTKTIWNEYKKVTDEQHLRFYFGDEVVQKATKANEERATNTSNEGEKMQETEKGKKRGLEERPKEAEPSKKKQKAQVNSEKKKSKQQNRKGNKQGKNGGSYSLTELNASDIMQEKFTLVIISNKPLEDFASLRTDPGPLPTDVIVVSYETFKEYFSVLCTRAIYIPSKATGKVKKGKIKQEELQEEIEEELEMAIQASLEEPIVNEAPGGELSLRKHTRGGGK